MSEIPTDAVQNKVQIRIHLSLNVCVVFELHTLQFRHKMCLHPRYIVDVSHWDLFSLLLFSCVLADFYF